MRLSKKPGSSGAATGGGATGFLRGAEAGADAGAEAALAASDAACATAEAASDAAVAAALAASLAANAACEAASTGGMMMGAMALEAALPPAPGMGGTTAGAVPGCALAATSALMFFRSLKFLLSSSARLTLSRFCMASAMRCSGTLLALISALEMVSVSGAVAGEVLVSSTLLWILPPLCWALGAVRAIGERAN